MAKFKYKKRESFSIQSRLKSFNFALQGAADLVINEHNARIHLIATLMVFSLAFVFSIERWEWIVLLLAIGGVWMAEALNTSIEYLADACHPDQHPLIKRAKDVAAAAVLFFAMAASMIGALVFIPYFLVFFS